MTIDPDGLYTIHATPQRVPSLGTASFARVCAEWVP